MLRFGSSRVDGLGKGAKEAEQGLKGPRGLRWLRGLKKLRGLGKLRGLHLDCLISCAVHDRTFMAQQPRSQHWVLLKPEFVFRAYVLGVICLSLEFSSPLLA